mgnify:CR=1 FL=1
MVSSDYIEATSITNIMDFEFDLLLKKNCHVITRRIVVLM